METEEEMAKEITIKNELEKKPELAEQTTSHSSVITINADNQLEHNESSEIELSEVIISTTTQTTSRSSITISQEDSDLKDIDNSQSKEKAKAQLEISPPIPISTIIVDSNQVEKKWTRVKTNKRKIGCWIDKLFCD